MIEDIYGVDVASKELVTHNGQVGFGKLGNNRKAIGGFLKGVPKDTVIALEATGGYGHLLAEMAYKRGHVVYMLQPGKVKDYCKSSPNRGKSDKNDAQDIASYVLAFQGRLHPYKPMPAFESKLRSLYRKREGIIDHITSLRKQLRALGDSPKEVERTLAKLVARVKDLAQKIEDMLEQAPDAKVLFKIPAVKTNLIAAALPALRTIAFKNKYGLDSYAGIDLKMNESGKFKGRRYISHEGDAHLRRAVYMAGFAGISCKVWNPYYRMLIKEKKLKPVQAINALGRKILHTVYGVYKSQKEFIAPTYA